MELLIQMVEESWEVVPGLSWILLCWTLVTWFAVGYFFAPWLIKRFVEGSEGYVGWMVNTFDRMFLTVSSRQCLLMILASMFVSGVLGVTLTSGLPMGAFYHMFRLIIVLWLVTGLFRVPTGYRLPRVIVNRMWERRIRRFEDQMLDALTFMSNGLKSGLSLIQSMDMVKEEMDDPLSQEFSLVLSEQRLGKPLEEALLGLEKRVGTEDVQIMVTSINILRQSGGNLTETFDTIAHTIRERKKVEGRIKTLTAQGVSQGVIIVCMPFVLAGVLYMMDQDLIRRLWTTPIGLMMLLFMLMLQVIGSVIIKKVVTIRV